MAAALVGSWISWDKWNLKLPLTSSQTKWNTSPEITLCWHYRDESASATYYCKKKSVSEPQEESTSNTEKEWIYYRKLKTGEEERCLRHKQVLILGLCSRKWGRSGVVRTNWQTLSLWPCLQSSAMTQGIYNNASSPMFLKMGKPTTAFFRA